MTPHSAENADSGDIMDDSMRAAYHDPVSIKPALGRSLRSARTRRTVAQPVTKQRGVWLPVVTLLLGSLLTLSTTIIAGRISAGDERQRQDDAFFREERVAAYRTFVNALVVAEGARFEAMDSANSVSYRGIDQFYDSKEVMDAAFEEIRACKSQIDIIGSELVIECRW